MNFILDESCAEVVLLAAANLGRLMGYRAGALQRKLLAVYWGVPTPAHVQVRAHAQGLKQTTQDAAAPELLLRYRLTRDEGVGRDAGAEQAGCAPDVLG